MPISFLTTFTPIANVLYAFRESNAPGKVIVGLLLLGSVFAWSIMVTKLRELQRAKDQSRRFIQAYRHNPNPLALYLKEDSFDGSPLHAVYTEACDTLEAEAEATGRPTEELLGVLPSSEKSFSKRQVRDAASVADRTMAEQAMRMEDNMGFLATAVTSAPFLGLLGTVWGVMEAFGGMVASGSAMLSAVAPGIAGALLTTVVGLVVALPSAIGYNMLTSDIRRLCIEMENFQQELTSDLERAFLDED